MPFSLFKRHLTPEAFWQWFVANKDEVAKIKTGQERIMKELGRRFNQVSPDIAFEIGSEGGTMVLVVSADGVRSSIEQVERLVAPAPAIAGWRIVKFRQRSPGARLQMGDISLDPEEIKFLVSDAQPGQKLDIVVFLPGLSPAKEKPLMSGAFILLDSVLGEYDVMTQIGEIDFRPLSEAGSASRPLTELADLVDARRLTA